MKKILCLFLSLLMLVSMAAVPVSAEGEDAITVYVNGAEVTTEVDETTKKRLPLSQVPNEPQATVINGTTMLPIRAICESMGCEVGWDELTEQITITNKDGDVIKLKVGQLQITKNNTPLKNMLIPPYVDNKRTMVPARAISEAFGAAVVWVEASKWVLITTDESYKCIYPFTEDGFAAMKDKDNKLGYLKKTEKSYKILCTPTYDEAYDFQKNDDKYYAVAKKGDVWYVIDENGSLIYNSEPMKNGTIYDFHNGVARVQDDDGKWSYIKPDGTIAIELKEPLVNAERADDFSNGFAKVLLKDQSVHYINIEGATVFNEYVEKFDENGIAVVKKLESSDKEGEAKEKYGYVKNDGTVLGGGIEYVKAEPFVNGFAKVEKDTGVKDAQNTSLTEEYYINENGDYIFDAYLDNREIADDKILCVKKTEDGVSVQGYVRNGQVVGGVLKYKKVDSFKFGFGKVTEEGKTNEPNDDVSYYIDENGKPVFDKYLTNEPFKDAREIERVEVKINKVTYLGFVTRDGQILEGDIRYTKAEEFDTYGYAEVTKDNNSYYINEKGEYAFDGYCKDAPSFEFGFEIVYKNHNSQPKKQALLRKDGKFLGDDKVYDKISEDNLYDDIKIEEKIISIRAETDNADVTGSAANDNGNVDANTETKPDANENPDNAVETQTFIKISLIKKVDNVDDETILVADLDGNLLYDEVDNPSEGIIRVKKDGKYGYINYEDCAVISPCDYMDAMEFANGEAWVRTEDGSWKQIDKKGNEIKKDIYSGETNEDGYKIAFFKGEQKYGCVDKSDNIIVPFIYASEEEAVEAYNALKK